MQGIRIGIIGGGIAGLTMAYLFSKQSVLFEKFKLDIHLFEATERLGGRVHTLQNGEAGFAELGALTIGDNETTLLSLIKELELDIVKRPDRQKRRYFIEGHWQASSDGALIMKFLLQEITRLKQGGIITEEMDWVSMQDKQQILADYDQQLLLTFLQDAITKQALILKDNNTLEISVASSLLGHYVNDVAQLSVFEALRFLSQYHETTLAYSIVNGNEQLPIKLAKIISATCQVYLHTPISQITTYANGKIGVASSALKDSLEFDYVVLAVPITSLQSHNKIGIRFKPPLSQAKQAAIDRTQSNQTVARIYYGVNSRFWWKDNPDTAMAITDQETLWIEDHMAHLPGEQAILEAHSSGKVGKMTQEAEDPAQLGKDQIAAVYGEAFQQACTAKSLMTFLWSKQLYQQGAYAFLLPNQRNDLRELIKNTDHLFFIGEYTAIGHPASINGAVRSAYREFDTIKALLREHVALNDRLRDDSLNSTLTSCYH